MPIKPGRRQRGGFLSIAGGDPNTPGVNLAPLAPDRFLEMSGQDSNEMARDIVIVEKEVAIVDTTRSWPFQVERDLDERERHTIISFEFEFDFKILFDLGDLGSENGNWPVSGHMTGYNSPT